MVRNKERNADRSHYQHLFFLVPFHSRDQKRSWALSTWQINLHPSGAAPWADCCRSTGGQSPITADVRNKTGRLNGHKEVPSEAVIALHLIVQTKELKTTENSAELDIVGASLPISLGTWAESEAQGDAKYSWSIWEAFHREGPKSYPR